MFIVSEIRALRRGGWLEVCDFVYPMLNFEGKIAPESALGQWNTRIIEASKKLGVGLDRTKRHATKMERAGFQRVHVVEYRWPLGAWATEAKYQYIGKQTGAWGLCSPGGL